MEIRHHLWGIEYQKLYQDPEYRIWQIKIDKPFMKDGRWQFGLNAKLLEEARGQGVKKLRIIIGQKEISMKPPSTGELKRKETGGEYEDRPSMFLEGQPIRIYHFTI